MFRLDLDCNHPDRESCGCDSSASSNNHLAARARDERFQTADLIQDQVYADQVSLTLKPALNESGQVEVGLFGGDEA